MVAGSVQCIPNSFLYISSVLVGTARRLSSAGRVYIWPFQHGTLRLSYFLHGSLGFPEGMPSVNVPTSEWKLHSLYDWSLESQRVTCTGLLSKAVTNLPRPKRRDIDSVV